MSVVHERTAIRRGYLSGLAAAAAFGASAPAAKTLLASWTPLGLAPVLYLGAALALTVARVVRRLTHADRPLEASVTARDIPRLAVIVVAGGFAGPILMLLGLQRLSGTSGALCLNLEAPLTMLLSVAVFGEHLSRREAVAAAGIIAGAVLLGIEPGSLGGELAGVLLVGAACGCWAVDNNLTQVLSARDPLALTQWKAGGAAILGLVVAALFGRQAPTDAGSVAAALTVGAVSYGLSIVLDTHALRQLGAAREAAIFATGPMFGAVFAVGMLGDRPSASQIAAATLMALGVVVLVRARHEHVHTHDAIEHEHRHTHDLHHQHEHSEAASAEPHSHWHRHEPTAHSHPHVSDAHHRHKH